MRRYMILRWNWNTMERYEILMKPEKIHTKKRGNLKLCLQLAGLVKPLSGYMILAILMGLAGNLCATFITILGGYAILGLLGADVTINLTAIFIIAVVIALLRGVLRYAEQACNHFIAFKLLALLRDKVFGVLRKLCPAKLEGKAKGNLISVITSDIELLEVFYAHTISPCTIALLFTVVMCVYIGQFHVVLAGIALLAYVTVGVVIPVIVSRFSSADGLVFRNKSGDLSGFVLESLRGLSEIMQYGIGKERLSKMNQKTQDLSEVEEKMKSKLGTNMAVTGTIIWVFDFFMLITAAYLYQRGAVGFDGVVLSVLALMSSFGPVAALANLGSTLSNTFAAGNRVLDILEETPVVFEVEGKEDIVFDGIKAENIHFAYEENPILEDFSLEVPKGKIIGITGRSGSGKSTFLKLLMRFWQTDSGKITFSEKEIDDINTSNLREMEGFVTQETHLFSDSIYNNLRVAKEDATLEEMMEACKKASIHDVIMSFPNGYDTNVGELGDTLSGGERQRIGLARAFLHDADLLLLDEPTSNLDSLNEGVILKSLKEECKGKTVILVSHRKSTMGITDVNYCVENGRMS